MVGADEYAENVDNNAFTNGMAITVLRYATEAAEELGLEPNPDWAHVANNIPIPTFEDGTTREYDGYNGQMIKQADVNLLAYPLDIVSDKTQVKKDLNYYQPKMDPNGPAMGAAILAVLYQRLGQADKAADIFTNSYKKNEVPPFGVISETAGGTNPYFATGAGGMLQAVLAGFGGISITNEGCTTEKTVLPKNWNKLTIKGIGIKNETLIIE